MKLIAVLGLVFWSLIGSAPQLAAQNYQSLFQDFDPRLLTQSDKRFLQTALAFEGHYNGLLDGAWGNISQRAMAGYSRSEFQSGIENWHMAMLAWTFFQLADADGWAMRYLPGLKMSMLWPEKAYITDAPSENFLNYRHSRSSLSISIGVHNQRTAQSLHNYTIGTHALSNKPYSVRKTSFAVSTATQRDGSTLYTRSNYVDGSWSTVMIHASKADKSLLNAIAASLAVGRTPPLRITPGGTLEDAILTAVAFAQEEDEPAAGNNSVAARPVPPSSESENSQGSGSGFVVSAAGYVLTNAHVVAGCRSVEVDGSPAQIVGISEEFDLALVLSTSASEKQTAVFSATSAKLNSDVTVIGFPYAGLLGGLNVTRGSVSSLKGLGGNETTMQITAPVQSGNSGGPLLSADGEVVGVVVAKLDAVKVADVMGDVPQNVNFAVRGEIAKLFLAQHGVEPLLSLSDDRLEPEVLAERARDFTVFVECK